MTEGLVYTVDESLVDDYLSELDFCETGVIYHLFLFFICILSTGRLFWDSLGYGEKIMYTFVGLECNFGHVVISRSQCEI